MASLDYINWDVIVPHHAWIKMGGSPDELKFKLPITRLARRLIATLSALLVAEQVVVNSVEHGALSNKAIRVNTSTFINQSNSSSTGFNAIRVPLFSGSIAPSA